ncbi:hypothetical protein BJF78_35105 [Pseudonocardia sp. CNS-139]|nr:hypothetical protein BJF78_35105 [Pseudonocardia sp. CNS-139]
MFADHPGAGTLVPVRSTRSVTGRVRERVVRAGDSVAESLAETAPVVQSTLRERPALVSSIAVAGTFLLIGAVGMLWRRRRGKDEPDGR